jgi:hypothetical protein
LWKSDSSTGFMSLKAPFWISIERSKFGSCLIWELVVLLLAFFRKRLGVRVGLTLRKIVRGLGCFERSWIGLRCWSYRRRRRFLVDRFWR